MPREFSHLVITKIRRIAHSPQEAECIARLLIMQVILVCVVHAAQKTWSAGRVASDDSPEDLESSGALLTVPAGIPDNELDSADPPGIPLRALWECMARLREAESRDSPTRNFSPGRHRLVPLHRLIHRPVAG
ncbi:MAG: hypothetical protein Q8R70_07675 [Methanoregula sp.]|nr:hypothetical protein [Methanoregula sp.]